MNLLTTDAIWIQSAATLATQGRGRGRELDRGGLDHGGRYAGGVFAGRDPLHRGGNSLGGVQIGEIRCAAVATTVTNGNHFPFVGLDLAFDFRFDRYMLGADMRTAGLPNRTAPASAIVTFVNHAAFRTAAGDAEILAFCIPANFDHFFGLRHTTANFAQIVAAPAVRTMLKGRGGAGRDKRRKGDR